MLTHRLTNLHARALCHATESLAKVEAAVGNVVGDADLEVSTTKGHHGNEITVVEATVSDAKGIATILARLGRSALDEIISSLDSRLDDSNNLFFRIDKQAAYAGDLRLSSGEDVVSVRVHVNAYPAKRDVAISVATRFIQEIQGQDHAQP